MLPPRDDDDAKEEVERPSEDALPFLPLAFEDDDEEEEEEESAPRLEFEWSSPLPRFVRTWKYRKILVGLRMLVS